MAHFGVIKCAYYVPRLGKRNYESQMRAILMIHSNSDIKQIKKETYLDIIHTLFYKYYQRWYDQFFNEAEKAEYKKVLDSLFELIKKDVENRKSIDINGYHNLLPLNPTDFNEIKVNRRTKILSFAFLFIVSIIFFGGVALFIQKHYKIDIGNQSAIFILAVTVASFFTSLFFGSKSTLASKIVDKLIDKY
jgi:hypothetical protein